MKALWLFAVFILVCGCQSSWQSPKDIPTAGKSTALAGKTNLTSDAVIKLALDLAKQHHEPLERFGPPRANYYPEHKIWNIGFANNTAYVYIIVRINDETGKLASYVSFDPERKPSHISIHPEESVVEVPPEPPNYRSAALKALINEANNVATQLGLEEDLPIVETNITKRFILPFAGALGWKAIGTVSTRNYSYAMSMSNKFCFLTKLNLDQDRARWHRDYVWPVSKMDTNAAYQLAIQWLGAVGADVKGLNQECRLHINASIPDNSGARTFTPVYSVYWVAKGQEGQGGEASVQLFLPTNTLLQLRISDPKYNLRPPLKVELDDQPKTK
jgi:hypothetical protein